jgi:hypothetical protein
LEVVLRKGSFGDFALTIQVLCCIAGLHHCFNSFTGGDAALVYLSSTPVHLPLCEESSFSNTFSFSHREFYSMLVCEI